MGVARHGTGPVAALRAFGSQVHPVFMLPPVAASWFGSVLAGEFSPVVGAVHALAVFFAVYTAHVKDGYVDFHLRDEDDDHPLSVGGCRLALVGATVGFAGCLAALWALVDPVAAAVTLPCWVIGYLHAPQLDMRAVTTTLGYPTGIALAILGGYYVQTETFAATPLAFSLVFLVILTGVKIIDDSKDYAYDRSIGKRTVAVVLGRRDARRLAYAFLVSGLGLVVGFASGGVFPVGTVAAAIALGIVVAVSARTTEPTLATMLLVRGSYVFLALLVAAVWYRPFS
ncbi:ubiquinone biosynthesis protein UbiA [Haloprofundus marisrubri]|uniref:Ubiquinone biosynthesis protein UbiA n=1 Tax=Haloprofundus marisrubri TaxID=1514971 RepID=A0A0W1RCJ4_9EURY|nr:ubiquinone biosynthesis protein UbiA [Haloprofundus marisrubri]